MKNEIVKKELPMHWWNFWKFFRFPAGLIYSIYALFVYVEFLPQIDIDLEENIPFFIYAIITIFDTILIAITYYSFLTKSQDSYKLFMYNLFIEIILKQILSTYETMIDYQDTLSTNGYITTFTIILIAGLTIYGLIWILPNYIYFKKRKDYFSKDMLCEICEKPYPSDLLVKGCCPNCCKKILEELNSKNSNIETSNNKKTLKLNKS